MTNTVSTTFTLTDVANTKIEYQPETVGLGTQIGDQTITTEYKFKKSDLSEEDFHRIIIGFC